MPLLCLSAAQGKNGNRGVTGLPGVKGDMVRFTLRRTPWSQSHHINAQPQSQRLRETVCVFQGNRGQKGAKGEPGTRGSRVT